jgi:hypothetical protein
LQTRALCHSQQRIGWQCKGSDLGHACAGRCGARGHCCWSNRCYSGCCHVGHAGCRCLHWFSNGCRFCVACLRSDGLCRDAQVRALFAFTTGAAFTAVAVAVALLAGIAVLAARCYRATVIVGCRLIC